MTTEKPEQAAKRLASRCIQNGFTLEAVHAYTDEAGNVIYWRIRAKHLATGEKFIRPMRLSEGKYELGEPDFSGKKPLYRLHEVAARTGEDVIVTEGEWTADHLASRGVLATTSGSCDSASRADWSVMAGRRVRIWPDNDEAGVRYGKAVAEILLSLGSTVIVIDSQALGLPEKGDAVDWLLANPEATASDIYALRAAPVGSDAIEDVDHGAVTGSSSVVAEDGAALLDAVYAFLGRFVSYPSSHAQVAHALWIAHAHAMDSWESTPRLAFLSPEPGSGKSRALEITETMVPRPVESINASPAYLFRKVSDPEGAPTILYDEIDTLFGPRAKDNEELRGLINAGHRRGATAGRCVVRGNVIDTEELPAYCAVALAGLGNLPDTIMSRSVIVRMRRRAPTEKVEPYRRRVHAPEGNELRERLALWRIQESKQLEGAYPDMPPGVEDRDADVWEPLLAVADAAGGAWPARAREAAVALVGERKAKAPSLGVKLLTDLRQVFGELNELRTDEVLAALCKMEDGPWGDFRGKPLNARELARLLAPYDIAPKVMRVKNHVVRGYRRADLADAWDRYVPRVGVAESVTRVTAVNANDGRGIDSDIVSSVAGVTHFAPNEGDVR